MTHLKNDIKKIENEFIYILNLRAKYKCLFEDKENISILNKIAGDTFFIIEVSMHNNLISSINRLLDPQRQGQHQNLTLDYIINHCKDNDLKNKLSNIYDEIVESDEFSSFKTLRDKYLSHTDYKKRQLDGYEIRFTASSNVEFILNKISNFFNIINTIPCDYTNTIGFEEDCKNIIYCLSKCID